MGYALGGAFYWPSYVFSIEPEVDGKSLESFQNSIIDIVDYRNEKLFTGKRSNSHGQMILVALGSCLVADGVNKDVLSVYDYVFSKNVTDKEIERIRYSIMKKMDGYDFADIVKAGDKCREELSKKSFNKALTPSLTENKKDGAISTGSEPVAEIKVASTPDSAPEQVKLEKDKKVTVGILQRFECGDYCYLIILRKEDNKEMILMGRGNAMNQNDEIKKEFRDRELKITWHTERMHIPEGNIFQDTDILDKVEIVK